MKKLILIGPINKGSIACTGDTMKNQLFLKRFCEVFDKVLTVDTFHWQKRPCCLIELVFKILLNPRAKIVLSANPGSADKMVKIIDKFGMASKTFYWVVGGSFHKMIDDGRFSAHTYKNLNGIFVQGQIMVDSMNKHGLSNVKYVPNSKYIDHMPTKANIGDGKCHFVFLSRIEREKGCDDIITAADYLNNNGYKGKFDITFFGKATSIVNYQEIFEKQIKEHPDYLQYKGVLNLKDTSNYNELAKYDVMLFPTYWDGEGFPGVIIDAYIAGLPVIASDWNLNRDVVKENETGWIIPTHDIKALAEKMIFAIDNPATVKAYSGNSSRKAMAYDSRNVLSADNLKDLGLI